MIKNTLRNFRTDGDDDANESVAGVRCMQRIWESVIKCSTGKSELRLPCAKHEDGQDDEDVEDGQDDEVDKVEDDDRW